MYYWHISNSQLWGLAIRTSWFPTGETFWLFTFYKYTRVKVTISMKNNLWHFLWRQSSHLTIPVMVKNLLYLHVVQSFPVFRSSLQKKQFMMFWKVLKIYTYSCKSNQPWDIDTINRTYWNVTIHEGIVGLNKFLIVSIIQLHDVIGYYQERGLWQHKGKTDSGEMY